MCAIRAEEYRPSTFVILLNCSNLAVLNLKVTAKRAVGILFPNSTNAWTLAAIFPGFNFTVKAKISTILSFIACLIALVCTIWISSINLIEIVARANGQYTFYSQRATLSDNEAVLYFSCWTLLFIVICWLSIKNLLRRRAAGAIIFAVVLLLLILLSTFVDKFFYHKLI